jgi:uncharacterized protein (DUF849 family)
MVFLQAALNGDRQHPAVPHTPAEIARDTAFAARAGVDSVHVHAFDEHGQESLDSVSCSAVLRAIRSLTPDLPISLTTSASIEADPLRRLSLIEAWTDLPDLVTANQGEPGIIRLSEHLLSRGVGIEAGLLTTDDARKFVEWSGRDRCVRVLIEPLDADPEEATRHAAKMERIVLDAGVRLPQVHHGDGVASWPVNQRALNRGHGIRTGLEDTPDLPDGSVASDNAALIEAAKLMISSTTDRQHRE